MAYTVQSGDSLYKIARDNGITYQELIRLNPQYADNPNLIRPGQIINLPQTEETTDDIDPGFSMEPEPVQDDGMLEDTEEEETVSDPFEGIEAREELLADPAYATFMAAFGMDKANINRTMKMNYDRLLQQATRNFGLYEGPEDASERNQLMSGSRSGGLYDLEFDKAKNVAVNQAAGRGMAFSGQTARTVGDLAEERLLAESDFQRDLLNAYNIAEQEKQEAADKLIKDKLEQERESYETLGIFQAGG